MSIRQKISQKLKDTPVGVKASVVYTLCSILQKCLSIVTTPIFTDMMTKEQYGDFTIYNTWMAIITILTTLNLAYGSFSKAMLTFEKERDRYIASCQCVCIAFSVIFLLLYIPLEPWLIGWVDLPLPYILLMVGEILMNTSIQFWMAKQRFELKYLAVIGVTLLISFSAPILGIIAVKNSEDKGFARVTAYAAVYLAVGAFFFIYNFIRSKKLFDWKMVKYALSFNIPLIVYYLSQVIFNQSDRIMIENITGKGDAAVYGVAYSISVMLVFVLNAINNSYVPWFYEKFRAKDTSENPKITLIISVIMSVLLLGVIWVAPEAVRFMGGKNGYDDAVWIVPPVAMSNVLLMLTQYCINIEFYFEQKKLLVYASVFSALINIGLNALFIPMFGFVAAGYTTLFSYVVFLIGNYIAMKWLLKKENIPNDFYDYKALGIMLAVFTALTALAMVLYKLHWAIRWSVIAVVMVVMLIERKKIIAVVKQVLSLKKKKA